MREDKIWKKRSSGRVLAKDNMVRKTRRRFRVWVFNGCGVEGVRSHKRDGRSGELGMR